MSKHILERYRRDENGKLIIDISASNVSDLYDDFDKQAPYIKKELDYDLVEYLINSATEIGREPFSAHFSFKETIADELQQRLKKSIQNYFLYLQAGNRKEILKMLRTAIILISLGLVILSISTYFSISYNLEDSVLEGGLSEGIIIAAWVAVWEGVEALLTSAPSLFRERKIYGKLMAAELTFHSPEN